MPIYKVQAPDGKVYKVEGPENADPELLFATVAQKHKFASLTTEQLNAMPSAGTSIGDVGRSLGTGLVGGVKSIADVFGAGTDVSEYLGETMQGLQAGLTPERQAEMARRAELIERADKSGSLMQQAKAYLGGVTEAPLQTTVQALGTSAPTIIAGLATLPVSAPAGIAAGVGIISRLAVGAAQGVGEFKGSAYEAVKGHYLKEGKSPEEAARLAEEAQQYSADKALQIGGAALLGSLDAVLGSENIAMRAMRRASPTGQMTKEAVDAGIAALPEKALTKPSLTRAFGQSVLGEAPLEGAQGAFGQYAQNVAMQQAGIDTPTEQGVFGSGLRDALVGGLAGGVFTPLQKSTMNSAYNIDQFLRQAKGEQEITAEAEAALKRKQETEDRVKTGLGVPTGETLALPAPAAKAEREIEPALIDLQNPVGKITRNELPAKTLSYIDKYRRENNLPRLTSFSLEDVKDAMTSQNPEGERAALDSIIAAKTGYTGKEQYKPEDILNAAVEKNIAPDTKGFSDFLQRATGERDVNTMSQPQLYSAFNALKATKASTTGEQIVLPEGSNATRFTTDQYNEGLTLLGKYLEQGKGKPLTMQQATDVVSAQTDLGDYAADILRVAANNDDVIIENAPVFQTVDNESGEITGTYGTEEDATKAAGKAATVQESRGPVVRSRIEEKQVKRAALPGGYELEEETLKEGEKPAEYQIMVEGKAKPLATVLEENDVAGKVERLQGLRQKEAGKVLADIQKNETTVNKGRAALESMEARGLMDTEGYKKAQAQQARAEDILGRRIQRMLDQIEELSAPLTSKPAGKKQITRQAFKLTKEGKEVGKFPSRAAAEESVLAQLSDAELETLTTQEGPTANRAAKALEARKEQKAGKTGIKVKGTTAGVEAAGVYTQDVQAKIDALSKQLVPMLAKFGLQDVGLNIVRTLQAGAEGSYLDKLIQVTLTAEKPIITMRHEALHALKDLGFFTPAQWNVLTKKANDEWIGKYLKGVNAEIDGKVMSRYEAYKAMGLTDEDIVEEAIADAFGAFELGTDKPTPGMIAALFKRLQDFFAAFAQALGRAKIESAEEIFGKIERGELAKAGLEQTAKEKLSLAPEGIPQKIWELHKKAIQADDESTGRTVRAEGIAPGAAKRNQTMAFRRLNNAVMEFVGDDEQKAIDLMVKMNEESSKRDGEKLSLAQIFTDNAWKADEATIKAADKYEEENGIRPYVSEGFLDLPTDGTKYSLQKYNPEKHLSFDATLGLPINKNGLVTLYYHTTKDQAVKIGNKKVIPSEGRNRVYLTNESNGAGVLRQRGNFDQELDGSSVLVYVSPDMLQVDDTEYKDGRRDFYVPLAQGDYFNKKMKLQSIQKSRTSPITEVFSYTDHEEKITKAVKKYKDATPAERRKLVADSRKLLKQEHNIGSLLSENGKLEKTRLGDYDLDWEGNSVASMGLGLASAQQISDKVSTCPRSAICEGLCLGETSGGNFMFGGAASEDVGDIQKSSFRAAARMMQYLKTEALVINPEAFATVLQAEIDSLAKWSSSETQVKIEPETKKRTSVEKEIYQPAVRLNVTSDFKPTMFRAIIEQNPDTMFYDYTKLGSETIAPNHHLTYSSTGFGQIVNGEKVFFKDKSGKYDHNWATMRDRRLNNGENVAMAFSSKSGIPAYLVDEETGVQYKVWNGDDYDARFLDPKQPDGKGMIIGLKNKAGTLSEKTATQKTGGFFVQYDPKTDGDTVVVPDQAQFKSDRKVIPIGKAEKLSLRTFFPSAEEAESAAYEKAPPQTREFKLFYGASTLIEEGRPQVMYHASPNIFTQFRDDKPIFVSPSASEAEYFGKRQYMGEDREKGKVSIYPLWVRAETPFDFENKEHVSLIRQGLINNPLIGEEFATSEERLSSGDWSAIEDPAVQDEIKKFGFDSFYVKEGETKNLAVYSAAQVKSVTGNIGEFDREAKDIRFSLRSFKANELPQKSKSYTLPANTLLYHGAHETRAKEIEIAGKVLISRSPIKTSGGNLDEGGLIFFGGKDAATGYANSENDLISVQAARERGESRKPGVVFETATDRPYRLMNKNYKLTKKEAEDLNKVLGIPDYKPLKEGDSASTAAYRAVTNSRTVDQYKTNKGEMVVVWPIIFNQLGYDGYFDDFAVALTADNGIRLVGKDGRLERFSLPTVSKAATDRVNATTTTREVKGFAERITDAISPKARSYFRAKAINRYNQLGVYDRKLAEKMGGVAFLADTSAEAGALFSDLGAGVTASALGFGDRNGGIPVYRNGVTTVDRSVKGLVASLAPLAAYGDPKVYQYYQYWAAVKRGTRLLEAGKERLINEGDKALAAELQKKFPEFVQVQKDYTAFNNGVVQYMVDTGVLSQERGNEYMKYADYVPFYRQADGETTIGPNIFQAIAGVKPPKKLKGSDAPLADFLETIVRNTQASIQAGMKNSAAQRAVNVAGQVTEPGMGVERLNTKQSGPDIINVLEKGEQVSYRTVDSLLVDAIGSLHMPDIPFLSILSGPSDVLRNLVTKDPGFMMANLMRDSLSAWVTSGQKMTPIAGTVINFGKALAGKSPGMEAMMDAGIIGGYEFSANVESSGEKLATDLARKSGKEGLAAPLRAARWLWEGLEKGTTASDAATRALVYERVMAETGNEAEALYRSLEVMNFNRKGSSPVIRVLTAAVPFFNARLQGLDLFYRASTGQMNMDNAKAIQKNFFVRGAMMAGLSTIYWFLTHDDEEYKKQEQETRDNNWLFPSAGIKIPTPFEVGVVFKTIPERILGYTFGDDTGKDFAKSMGSAMLSTFAFNPIPQTVKPIVEVATNFSFFTMRPIIGQGMEDVASKYQVGPSTSKAFEAFGSMTGLSPMKVEYLYKGYTGTMGMYLVDVVDSILNAASNSPNATKRFEQLPVIKRFALDPEARGNITQYYELKNSVDSTVKTMNLLEKTARPEDFSNYVQQNIGYLANKDYVRDLEKTMKELREMRTAVRSSGMSGDDKRESLKLIGQMENNLTSNIQTVKKTIASMQ